MIGKIAKSDPQIHQDVLNELKWDTRVDETEVGVEVDQGVVTLTGTVQAWGKRVAAEQAAHRVLGVLDVANDIRVKPAGTPGRTDTELAQAVRQALEWNTFVPDKRIRSTVSDGVVTLEGEVDTWAQRADAEEAVQNLLGVIAVVNAIKLQPPKADPAELRQAIKDALRRHAEREGDRIQVTVRNGTVRISGHVDSHLERHAVLGAVKGTYGVKTIEDALAII